MVFLLILTKVYCYETVISCFMNYNGPLKGFNRLMLNIVNSFTYESSNTENIVNLLSQKESIIIKERY